MGIFLGLLIVAVFLTLVDIAYIVSGEVEVTANESEGNVHIENSSSIITPWVRWGYSLYLNHFNKNTKDLIKGSTKGVVFEWFVHNVAYMFGVSKGSTKHLDIGSTIFKDTEVHPVIKDGEFQKSGIMSITMILMYYFYNSYFWEYDWSRKDS